MIGAKGNWPILIITVSSPRGWELGWANSSINRIGSTEFDALRVVDSGDTLASILPGSVQQYTANLYAVDASFKYRGWSFTSEYYFRLVNDFDGATVPNLFDYGYWLQLGKFVIPREFEMMVRWSNVTGNSGTLGVSEQSSAEIALGCVRYYRGQNAKITFDATYLDAHLSVRLHLMYPPETSVGCTVHRFSSRFRR